MHVASYTQSAGSALDFCRGERAHRRAISTRWSGFGECTLAFVRNQEADLLVNKLRQPPRASYRLHTVNVCGERTARRIGNNRLARSIFLSPFLIFKDLPPAVALTLAEQNTLRPEPILDP